MLRSSLSLLAICIIATGTVWAETPVEKISPTASASADKSQITKPIKVAVITKPLWEELKSEQKSTLAPLQTVWLKMSEGQKRKWLEVSKNYDKFSAADKAKLQDRMRDWAKLSPEQRAQARINFSQAKKLSADEKQKQWQAYQALSAEERQKLQSKAKSSTPNSAALAAKPQNKVVPLAKKSPASAASAPTAPAPAAK